MVKKCDKDKLKLEELLLIVYLLSIFKIFISETFRFRGTFCVL